MIKILLFLICFGALGMCLVARGGESFDELNGPQRIESARKARGALIAGRFSRAGVNYPPAELFLRAFKAEAELELWARSGSGPFIKIHTYPVLARSGVAGPKRREGDGQIPEGFYLIDRFNPQSRFHLSLGINYPTAYDRIHGDPQRPGSEIFIHGKAVSVGCLAMGDEAIEEIFLAALDTRAKSAAPIAVHIFPARMSEPGWQEFLKEESSPELRAFWAELRGGYELFERDHRNVGALLKAPEDGRTPK